MDTLNFRQQRILGLKCGSPYWDLPCLQCGANKVRLLELVFELMPQESAEVLCNCCYSRHIIRLIKRYRRTFSVVVETDTRDHISRTHESFNEFSIYQTRRKRKSVRPKLVERVFRKTRGRCDLCGIRLQLSNYGKRGGWHVDHRSPVSRGGTNDFNNLWPACESCNTSKQAATKKEYLSGATYSLWDEL
jgi:5-methylcytosine-specific restriction endonuclease McrA